MTLGDHLRSYRSVWALGVALTAAGPLALWVPELQPPWPEGSAMIAAVFCVVAAVLAFSSARQIRMQAIRKKRGSEHTRSSITFWLGSSVIIMGLACGIYYIMSFDQYVVSEVQVIPTGTREIRIVIGDELRDEFQGATQRPLQLLREHGYEPDRIWTRESLVHSRFKVLMSFISMFALLTFGLGLLAANSIDISEK